MHRSYETPPLKLILTSSSHCAGDVVVRAYAPSVKMQEQPVALVAAICKFTTPRTPLKRTATFVSSLVETRRSDDH